MRSLFVVLVLAASLIGAPAMAIESPKHQVELTEGKVELRRYAPYVVAEVEVGGDQKQAVQAGFRKLAGYIFGANQGRAKIAMTAPVAQAKKGVKIAMTAPVAQTPAAAGRWTVQFMMPSAYSLDTLPRPNDPDVSFRQEPARRMAVLTYSGVANAKNFAERTRELETWIAAKGLKARSGATLAQYDPPWTPWFMRKNEVQIEVGN